MKELVENLKRAMLVGKAEKKPPFKVEEGMLKSRKDLWECE